MSAYIVSHSLIDAVLTIAVHENGSYGGPRYRKTKDSSVEITEGNATEIGRVLLAENERSVMHRYPGGTLDDMPGKIGERSANYYFKPRKAEPVAVLKALDCLDYQSCETDDWQESEAFRVVAAIRDHAISRLPGYENGPGWDDFDRKRGAAA